MNRLKMIGNSIGIVFVLLLGLNVVGVVGLHYNRFPANNPLRSVARVERVEGKVVVMADGRSLEINYIESGPTFDRTLEESDFLLELEPFYDQGNFRVFASIRDRHTPIGSDFHAPIVIPVFPFDRENLRTFIGFAILIDDQHKTTK